MRHIVVAAVCLALVLSVWAVAQQAVPSCEDRLAQTQAHLGVVSDGRAASEYQAADAIAALRKQRDQLQRELEALREQLAEKSKAAEERGNAQ